MHLGRTARSIADRKALTFVLHQPRRGAIILRQGGNLVGETYDVITTLATAGLGDRVRAAPRCVPLLDIRFVPTALRTKRLAVNQALVGSFGTAKCSRGLQQKNVLRLGSVLMLALDVVVRTLADVQRSELLFRALDSIQNQSLISARPIVVVNGNRYDPHTLAKLERRPGIVLHRLQQASTGDALAEGRRLVTAAYFAYLDDDDVFIPDSLLEPLKWMASHSDCDVLISNGYFVKGDGTLSEFIHISDHVRIGQPALSLLDDGWLAPGTSVFRTKSIPQDMLDSRWVQMEWTRLAFEICAAKKRIHFMDIPTALYYDTPGSMSKDAAHQEAALDLMRSIRSDPRMSREVRTKADKKYHNGLHIAAARCGAKGDLRRAWRYHFASMHPPYTFDYLLFSRKLLWPARRSSKKEPHPI